MLYFFGFLGEGGSREGPEARSGKDEDMHGEPGNWRLQLDGQGVGTEAVRKLWEKGVFKGLTLALLCRCLEPGKPIPQES